MYCLMLFRQFSSRPSSNVLPKEPHCSFFKELSEYFPAPLEDKPLKDWFDFFYDILLEKYRCEYVYKNILTTQLFLEGKHFPKNCWLINEWRVNKSRADIVIMNGESTLGFISITHGIHGKHSQRRKSVVRSSSFFPS